mgnify:CR=1 FL=1
MQHPLLPIDVDVVSLKAAVGAVGSRESAAGQRRSARSSWTRGSRGVATAAAGLQRGRCGRTARPWRRFIFGAQPRRHRDLRHERLHAPGSCEHVAALREALSGTRARRPGAWRVWWLERLRQVDWGFPETKQCFFSAPRSTRSDARPFGAFVSSRLLPSAVSNSSRFLRAWTTRCETSGMRTNTPSMAGNQRSWFGRSERGEV